MNQVARVVEMLKGLVEGAFYGEIQIKFEAGKIVVIKKIESIKV